MYTSDVEWHTQHYGSPDKFGYKDFIPLFTVPNYHFEDCTELFKSAGAKYVVPVAEHHDGFAMGPGVLARWAPNATSPANWPPPPTNRASSSACRRTAWSTTPSPIGGGADLSPIVGSNLDFRSFAQVQPSEKVHSPGPVGVSEGPTGGRLIAIGTENGERDVGMVLGG